MSLDAPLFLLPLHSSCSGLSPPLALMALETSSSSLGQFDIANLPMRVVTSPRPRPLINLNDDKTVDLIREIFGEELESTAVKIANNKAKKIYAVLR